MAAGHHDGNETEFHRLKQATPHDLLVHQVHSGAAKNMREVSRIKDKQWRASFRRGQKCVNEFTCGFACMSVMAASRQTYLRTTFIACHFF